MRIFISFANEQSRVAESIYLKLLAADYEVFFASDDIRASDEYDERIRQEVAEADKLIFLASQESLTEGKFTLTELRMFSEKWPDPTGRVMTVMLNDLSYNDLPPYLGAVTSVFKAKGNIPSEVVATVVSQWPLRNKNWGLWGVIAASLVVPVVVFLFIKTNTTGRESENSVRGSEIPAPTRQIASQLDDATAIPTRTPSPTATPNPSPTFTHTPTPTATPTPVPSTTNTPTPTPLPTGSESIPSIEFNTGEEAITLTFRSRILSRKDTFQIDPNKTVGYLKDALIRHYEITIPEEFSDRNSDGGYDVVFKMYANHSPLEDERQSLVEAGVKEFDEIELWCVLSQRLPMACHIPDVAIVIEGIGSYNPEFMLNGRIPDRIEEKEDAYHFYFNYVGECNPISWIGTLVLGDDVYFLVNPRDISENGTGKIMEFDFTGEGN